MLNTNCQGKWTVEVQKLACEQCCLNITGTPRPGNGQEMLLSQGTNQHHPQQNRVLQQLQQGDWRLQQLHHLHHQQKQPTIQEAYIQQVQVTYLKLHFLMSSYVVSVIILNHVLVKQYDLVSPCQERGIVAFAPSFQLCTFVSCLGIAILTWGSCFLCAVLLLFLDPEFLLPLNQHFVAQIKVLSMCKHAPEKHLG